MVRTAVLALFAAPLFGGCGLFLDLGNPSAASDPAAHGAFVTVRLFNCFGQSRATSDIPFPRESATIAATAEGLVDGRRVSIPLRVTGLSVAGLSAVWWDPPNKGVWALRVSVTGAGPYFIGGIEPPVLGALVAIGPNGPDRRPRLLGLPPRPDQVDTMLADMDPNRS
jgi:hypothetical protein